MKILTGLIVIALLLTDLDKIGKINTLKSEAKKAYLGGDYKTAIEKYRYLVDSLGVNEDEVMMNLANAYFESQDTTHTFNAYQSLTQSQNRKINSLANQQLGVIENRQGKFEEALNHFKQAMKADPENEDARYNYELVKKKLEEKKKQEQQQQNKDEQKKDDKKDQQNNDQRQDKDQQNKDKKDEKNKQEKEKKDDKNKENQDKEKQDKEKQEKEKQEKEKQQKEQEEKDKDQKEKKDIPPSAAEKLKEMQISEDKAKMILEAMKNQEIQYLQQNKRKATKPKDKGKPDW